MTQTEIAQRLRVSRVTVLNLLREARDVGILQIRVDGRQLTESTLARQLREAFGLTDIYLADTFDEAAPDHAAILRQVGRVAAMAFLDVVSPGDRVGVAWGETVLALSRDLPERRVEGVEINQLVGSMVTDRVQTSEHCAMRIASRIGAQCHTLHAPALATTGAVAELFRAEPTIAAQLDRLISLDMVVYSIGDVSEHTHMAAAGMATPDELHAAKAAGAQGILCCRYIDDAGNEYPLPPADRLIAASLCDLRRAKKRLLVVCGEDRAQATKAAISGGFVTHLCLDTRLANRLLSLAR